MEISQHVPATEVVTSGLLTTFDHHVEGQNPHKLTVQITPGEHSTLSTIYIGNGKESVGIIQGSLFLDNDKKLEFMVNHSMNFSKILSEHRQHIPGVVKGTIAHLVGTGLVSKWSSDIEGSLSDDAKKMYGTNLAKDERLTVIPPTKETNNRYVVTRKVEEA